MINFKNSFNSKSVEPTPTPAQPVAREFGQTRKKKNTYIVNLNTIMIPGAHELCQSSPLPVIKINGVETENAHRGWMSGTNFPNPGASTIEKLWHRCPEWRIIMGNKMASTIIEYMDKESGKPVLQLYPSGHVVSMTGDNDIEKIVATRLNHASRNDIVYQHKRIAELVEIVNPLLAQRSAEMAQAPKDPVAREKFVAELNRRQIERANQIVAAR